MHSKKPKKKFRARTKQSAARATSPQPHKASTAPAVPAKKSVLDRVLDYARVADDPPLRARYAAIFGRERPIDDFIATNLHLISGMKRSVSAAFEAYLNEHSVPVFRQVTRIGVTPGSTAEIPVPAIRKAARLYDQAKVDCIAAVQIIPVPYQVDPHGLGLTLQLDALLFGEASDVKVAEKERGSRSQSEFRRSGLQRLDICSATSLADAISGTITPSFSGVPVEGLFDDPMIAASWPDDADRDLRAIITMMARAQLPLKSMLILRGAGKPVFAHAVTEARRQLEAACKAAPPLIHRDGLLHFFFAELRRMGLDDISVPLVTLR